MACRLIGNYPAKEYHHYWPGCAKVGDNKVVIAGGSSRMRNLLSRNTLQTTEILDLNTKKISTGGKMATARRWFHIISFKYKGTFKMLAVGG